MRDRAWPEENSHLVAGPGLWGCAALAGGSAAVSGLALLGLVWLFELVLGRGVCG